MKPLVSVIIPAYNSEKVIERCLKSLIEQTLKNIEIIVVDDGSTDGTYSIVDKYVEEYEIIKCISQTNQGAGAARNKGLANAMGEFIGFVDADDYVMPTMFEELYKEIVQTDSDCAICNYQTNSTKVNLFENTIFKISEVTRTTGYVKYIAKNPEVWNKLYKRECISDLKFDIQMKMGEDLLFNTKAYEKMKRIVIIDKVLYHYKNDGKSITRTNKKVDYKNMIRSYCEDNLISTPDLDVYQGLVFLTGFIFSTAMNKRSPKYMYQELKYLLKNKGEVFDEFIVGNQYYSIAKEDSISRELYYAYKVLFALAKVKLVWISALGFWGLAKVIRIGR